MKNTFGNRISYTLFGESHGSAIGVVVDGLPAGIEIDLDMMNQQMDKRRAKGKISTQRREGDRVEFVSGYFNGHTTGSPLTILIQNENKHSKDYDDIKYRARPGHADFTANEKYHGFQDFRGGGHFSGRITAPLVAAGSIALQILEKQGIHIGTHILKCKDIYEDPFSDDEKICNEQLNNLNDHDFPTISDEKGKEMIQMIEETAKNKDSVGGILESIILNVPTGLGEPFFDSIESTLSHLLFSVPAIKGVEFGLGFNFSDLYGSEGNDPLYYDGKIKTKTNHNGGINGGISNGMPIRIKSVVKPTSSIFKPQETINLKTKEKEILEISGRHDPAIIHRARVVVDSVLAIGILDLLVESLGCEAILKERG